MENVKHKDVFIRAKGADQALAGICYLESLGCTDGWYYKGNIPPISEAIVGDWKCDISWVADIDYLVNEGFKEIFIPTKHKHYDLIVAWAADPSQKVWRKESSGYWQVETPAWDGSAEYHIGQQPPKQTITIGDQVIDAPELSGLANGSEYFLPEPSMSKLYSESLWANDNYDSARLKHGQVHLNKEAAIAHAKALIKISGGCVDGQ